MNGTFIRNKILSSENMKGKYHFRNVGLDERIILKWL
jgi:hypothetical protein